MTRDNYEITGPELAALIAEASSWDNPDTSERPQSWAAFGEDPEEQK